MSKKSLTQKKLALEQDLMRDKHTLQWLYNCPTEGTIKQTGYMKGVTASGGSAEWKWQNGFSS